MIIITPNQGSPSAFELVRVTPDKVEVSKEGVRLQFARHQIRQIRIPEAGNLVVEAVEILSRVEIEDITSFASLIPALEAKVPGLSNQASRFGWLIPDASPTLNAVKQAIADMRSTLQATRNLQETGQRIEAMANGGIPLSATWEEQINLALAETNRIPYMKIRKETLDRFLLIRRRIRLDLTQANQEATTRARNLLEDLQSELQAGTLTEAGSELLIKETKRYVERVMEPSERANLESNLAKAAQISQQWFSQRTVRESAKAAQGVFATVQAEIKASSPTVHLESILPWIFQLRRLVAEVPESSTKEALAAQLETLENTLRTLPPPMSKQDAVVARADTTPKTPTSTAPPSRPAGQLDQLKTLLQSSLTDWRVWAGLCFVLLLLNLKRRKAHLSGTNTLHSRSNGGSGSPGMNGGADPSRKSISIPVQAFPDVSSGKENVSLGQSLEDPLQQSRSISQEVELDAYGRIKKKRNTQG